MKAKQTYPAASFLNDSALKIHPKMKEFIGYCLYRLALRIRSRIDEGLEEFGLIAPQCAILSLVNGVGSMTQVELGKHLAIDKATMVRFIDGLEGLGLIQRTNHETDRRAKVLKLTKAGERLIEKVRKIRLEAENAVLAPLSASERQQFLGMVSKLTLQD